MSLTQVWLYLDDIVKYVFPTVAIVLSIISFIDSKKANKIKDRLNEIDEKLKNYELEEKEKEREEATKANIESRVINISKQEYRLKIWNSGKSTAYNVDFIVQKEYTDIVLKRKVPYESLDPGKSFEEIVLAYSGMPDKFKVTTTWIDEQKISHSKEQMLSID